MAQLPNLPAHSPVLTSSTSFLNSIGPFQRDSICSQFHQQEAFCAPISPTRICFYLSISRPGYKIFSVVRYRNCLIIRAINSILLIRRWFEINSPAWVIRRFWCSCLHNPSFSGISFDFFSFFCADQVDSP
jgi:hypothetical protein